MYDDYPAIRAFPVTPSDTLNLSQAARALYIGTAGDITVLLVGDTSSVLFKNVPVGVLPVQARRVYSTGTTASQMMALLGPSNG